MSVNTANIERILWPNGKTRDVWMIVDAARESGIYGDIVNSYCEYSCLYTGDINHELERAAPHLVQLEYDDKYSRRLIQKAWGKSWGVLLRCDSRMERLRRHLRTFLIVNDSRGRRLLFRYYDPRVLRVYLPTCVPGELRSVFGPIEQFWTEDESASHLLEFDLAAGRLRQSVFAADA